jgi:hypothetical protein
LTQEGKEWGIWIHRPDFLPLYTLRSGWKVPCMVLGVRTPRACYPDTNRGPGARQSNCVGQTSHVRQKAERPMGVAWRPRESRRFENHHSNYISTRDAHYSTTGLQRGKPSLQCFIYQMVHYGTTCQCGVDTCLLIEPHYRGIIQGHVLEGLRGERRSWPHL